MKDLPLPLLSPTDPKNRLSDDARRRINRTLIDSEKIKWRAEAFIENQNFDPLGVTASRIRNEAHLEFAEAVLKITHREFARLAMPLDEFRSIMRDEIEAAVNSLELLATQRQLLESEFCFPPESSMVYVTPRKPPQGDSKNSPPHRHRQMVDEFLALCNDISPARIRRSHIWKAVGHQKGRQFEYWQACSTKATAADNRNFERMLSMDPGEFLALLQRKKLI